jgi:hypothetical protein
MLHTVLVELGYVLVAPHNYLIHSMMLCRLSTFINHPVNTDMVVFSCVGCALCFLYVVFNFCLSTWSCCIHMGLGTRVFLLSPYMDALQ